MVIFLSTATFIISAGALLIFLKQSQKNKIRNEIVEIDESLPTKTIIYFSKKKSFLHLVFFSVYTLMVLRALLSYEFTNYFENIVFGSFALLGLTLSVVFLKQFFNNHPQFIIDDLGFEIVKKGFKSWSDIENERVYVGKKSRILYTYKEVDKEVFGIYLYDASFKEIKIMLKTYRARYEASKKQKVISE